MPLSQEQVKIIWLDQIGGPSRYETAYCMPQRLFREFHSGIEGLGSSHDDGLMHQGTISAIEQKIVDLSSQLFSQAETSQYRHIHHQVYDQYSGLVDEPSNDEDEDEDKDD
ncbi:hypothetical protein HAX54_021449 [Datura stramonium]|uniref:Uncharacterized protein n=1 Tax=Datura stramonium TaxID=4076 RepID=A0ABS8S6S6_DATST|nr:hypothetical protein [Datura stramonium]